MSIVIVIILLRYIFMENFRSGRNQGSKMNSIYFYETSIGRIGIADNGEAITRLLFVRKAGAKSGLLFADNEKAAARSYDKKAVRGLTASNEEASARLPAEDDECLAGHVIAETPLIKKASVQLSDYLEGKRKVFDVPLSLEGTEFQKAVWKALKEIPYGETRSYRQIAERIGNPKACRAVGMANNRNPVAIIVPCHRVIGADGKLVGYGGGIDIKENLLALERRAFRKQ